MHEREWYAVSVLLLTGRAIIWNAWNCSCIFEISRSMSDLILFLCCVSRLFAASSFGFAFSIFQSSSCHHQLFGDWQFFQFFSSAKACYIASASFSFQKDFLCLELFLDL
jgi:hypothetical protein